LKPCRRPSQTNRIGGFASALLGLLCASAVLLTPVAAAAGSISGTVTDAVTEDPIGGLDVCFGTWIGESNVGCAKTDPGGEYTMSLPPGEYFLTFWGRPLNYENDWAVVTVGSDPVTDVDAELDPFGSVEGTVRAEVGGEAVEDARVCVLEFERERFFRCTRTDASGHYVIADLPPDEYRINFWANGQNFLWQYHDHVYEAADAEPVFVGLNQVVDGIDADLPPAAEVEGMVRRADNGAPFRELFVNFRPLDEDAVWPVWPTRGTDDGSFSMVGLPPGDYKVEFLPYDSDWSPQFWDHKASLEESATISLVAGTVTTGIDADIELTPTPTPQPAATPQLLAPSVVSSPLVQAQPPPPKRRVCPKGFRKKRVAGKVRCVRKHKRHHQRHR